MQMNSLDVEQAKTVLIPLILSTGGIFATYYGYFRMSLMYGYFRFLRFKPSNEMLKQAWEGFEYDPQNKSAKQFMGVLNRTNTLYERSMRDVSQVIKKQRFEYLDDPRAFVQVYQTEIKIKTKKQKDCLKLFINFKNHSFEQFEQDLHNQANQYIKNIYKQHHMLLLLNQDEFGEKLPSINQCIDSIKKIIPLIKEKKPELDRICNLTRYNGASIFQELFLITYISDVLEKHHNIQLQKILVALRFFAFEKVLKITYQIKNINLRNEAKTLSDELYRMIRNEN